MDLTGGPFLGLLALLTVAAPAAAVLLWGRVPGARAVRFAQRLGLVVLCQLTAVMFTAALVNDQFSLYESWDDLFGGDAAQGGQVEPGGGDAHGPGAAVPAAEKRSFPPLEGDGRVLHQRVQGPRSRITSRLWVLLPPGYSDPANSGRRYPVVMFLSGYPGTPTTWLHALDLQRVMDREVQAGRVQPFIGVLPTMNVAAPRDTECADVPGGPQVSTWLGDDVPQIVEAQTRALPPGPDWGVTGYSTGGFCAAKLLLAYPHTFGSAAVLAGYYSPSHDVTTGDLYGGDERLRQQNDPQWLVTHRPTPAVRLLAVWSAQDPETAGPTQRFLAAVRPPLRAEQIRLARGGHNTSVWLGVLPQVLQWLDGPSATR